VLVGRPGEDVLITGDMIHSPIQGRYPELGMRADYDSPQVGKTRRQVFDRLCEEPTLMCVTHFPVSWEWVESTKISTPVLSAPGFFPSCEKLGWQHRGEGDYHLARVETIKAEQCNSH